MIPADAEYQAFEVQKLGASPAVRATFLPFLWPPGVNGGAFTHCAFVAPGRIQADYAGFSGGQWISEVLNANLQIPTSPAVFTWGWNYPGFDGLLYWRTAANAADLAAAAWTLVNQGDTLNLQAFYQFKLTLEGYRAWAVDEVGDADDFTAWAEDDPGLIDAYQGYAAEDHVRGDPLCYIENLQLLGEFTVVTDIEKAGTVTQEMPKAFDDLVAGVHSGLLLNNRQNSVAQVGGVPVVTQAPLYSPDKGSFLFASEANWYGKQLRIDLGWSTGGFLAAPFLEDSGLFEETWTEFLTLFLGKLTKWGPVVRAVDQDGKAQANTVEIYAKDFLADCLQKRIALPAADGTPQPLTFGEFLCQADAVIGWSPAPILRSAYFAAPNYNELDHVVALGGGAFSLAIPGLMGVRAFRASVSGPNQSAYGSIVLPYSEEIFVTGTLCFQTIPGAIANLNMTFLQIIDASGAADFAITIDNTGAVYSNLGGQSKFNLEAYQGVPLPFALWVSPTNPGYAKLFLNGDEVLTFQANLSGDRPLEFRFGADTGATAESWIIDFDDIKVRSKYFLNAFRVTGAPFKAIGPVYLDNVPQPDSQTVGSNIQTLTRFPEYGLVQFTSTDSNFKPSGTVLARVINHPGGVHALDIIQALFAQTGLSTYLDDTALAAAYAACPNDLIHARFDGSSSSSQTTPGYSGLQDLSSVGITIADCLKAICSRMLYWVFIDAGKIKVAPYTGIPPASPVLAFDGSNLKECDQIIDMDSLNNFVSAVYGWYSRNPSLYYLAQDAAAQAQDAANNLALAQGQPLPYPVVVWTGVALDFSWGGSSGGGSGAQVACENRAVVQSKVDLLLKFLSAQERLEPIKSTLAAARLDLTDVISIADPLLNDTTKNYLVSRKIVSLDAPRGTELQALRFLGEN